MFFNVVPIEVYRKTVPSGFLDPTWAMILGIQGTVCPIKGSDLIRNNQKFADVQNKIICDLDYIGYVKDEDELIINSSLFYRAIFVVELKNVLPHVEILVGESQWERD